MIQISNTLKNQKRFLWALVIIIFSVFGNSIDNEYSLDDEFVVLNNTNVMKGISGISKIFKSRYAESDDQSFGYRPLVLVSFALEKEIFGNFPASQTSEEKAKSNKLTQANLSHLINVLLYIANCALLFFFLIRLFPKVHFVFAALVTLLFALHPVHTEVVDSLKNRDELLAFLGMFGGINIFLKTVDEKFNYKPFLLALLLFLFAFLCKKTSIVLVGILPLVFYFRKASVVSIIKVTTTSIVAFALVVVSKQFLNLKQSIRVHELYENELFGNDGALNRVLLSISSTWEYLRLLTFPKELSFYYGYAEVTKSSPADFQFWIILVLIGAALYFGFKGLVQRSILGFGLALLGGVLIGYLNILAPVVGVVAERFTYIFSIGYCIILVWALFQITKVSNFTTNDKIRLTPQFIVVLLLITSFYSMRTIDRNNDWENKISLLSNDCEHLGKSAKANALYGQALFHLAINEGESKGVTAKFRESAANTVKYLKLAVAIDSTYTTCYANLGGAYLTLFNDFDNGVLYSKKALRLDSSSVEVSNYLAFAYQNAKDLENSNYYFKHILKINPKNIGALNNYVVNASKMSNKRDQIVQLISLADSSVRHGALYRNIYNILSSNKLFDDLTPNLLEKALKYEASTS